MEGGSTNSADTTAVYTTGYVIDIITIVIVVSAIAMAVLAMLVTVVVICWYRTAGKGIN